MSDRVAAVLIDPTTGLPYTAIPVNIGSTVNRTASGNITSTQDVALSTAACGSAAFQVMGTWTGTLDFEYTIDDLTWNALSVTPDSGGPAVSSTTANGNWTVQVESYSQVRVRGNTVGSGTAAIFLSASTATSVVTIASPLPAGDNTIGRVKITDGADVAAVSVGGALSVDASATTALPLPTGAATADKQPALGTAGTPSADVVSVQGVAGGTALPVTVSNAFALDATLTGGAQRTKITDGANNAAVVNVAPTTEYGLVVRPAPAGATAPSAVELSDGSAFYTAAKTGQLPSALGTTNAAGSLSVTVASDKATAAAPLGVELSDGSAYYTGAKTGQLPSALGATTKAASLSVAPATDSVGTAGTASSTVYTVQGTASMTAVQVTPPAGIGQQTLAASLSVGLNSNQVGTAGSPSTTVLSVQGATSMTPVQVAGSASSGASPTTAPLYVAGVDTSGFVRPIEVDTAGRGILAPATGTYITSNGTTQAITGSAAILYSICVNPGTTSSLLIYNSNGSSSNLVYGGTTAAPTNMYYIQFGPTGMSMPNGITYTMAGGASAGVLFLWRAA